MITKAEFIEDVRRGWEGYALAYGKYYLYAGPNDSPRLVACCALGASNIGMRRRKGIVVEEGRQGDNSRMFEIPDKMLTEVADINDSAFQEIMVNGEMDTSEMREYVIDRLRKELPEWRGGTKSDGHAPSSLQLTKDN